MMIKKGHEIIRENNIDNLSLLVEEYDLILLDLDDVVMTSMQYLCSSSWYSYYHATNKEVATPIKLIKDLYNCLNTTLYKPVSSSLNEIFSQLSSEKLVLGLTARVAEFSFETSRQIASVNMSFSLVASENNFYFNDKLIIKNGIIFAGYNQSTAKPDNKGFILEQVLNSNILGNIENIVFIDDSLKNLEEVRNTSQELGISFLGIHFTLVKDDLLEQEYLVDAMNDIADTQFHFLENYKLIPSNEWLMYYHTNHNICGFKEVFEGYCGI
jgi:hypothetical protein